MGSRAKNSYGDPMTITTRPATGEDVPALLALFAELHLEDPAPSAPAAAAAWRAIEDQTGRTVLVAESGGGVVGTLDCTTLPNLTRGARSFMLVENVVVAAGHRRSGVGAALMEAALGIARRTQCYKVQLLSRDSREAAHAFYESLGFRAVAQGYRRYL
jgi:ribosomal protein S18 acetylase RimI-like enzyme